MSQLTVIFVFALSLFPSFAFAGDGGLAGDKPTLRDFSGVYRGYAPTDESALGVGEIEIAVSSETISVRMATGLTILSEQVSTADFELMSAAEVEAEFVQRSPYAKRTLGFKGPTGSPKLLFLLNPSTNIFLPGRSEFGLIVITGGMADLLGNTALLSPAQQRKLSCERYLRAFEFWTAGSWRGGLIPRLRTGGRAPQDQ